ncbi:MAG: diguanylate cyclase [Oscillospiraceae bacterium]|nr:diguanylate cyclase [Oscillospiraceae bacterium]
MLMTKNIMIIIDVACLILSAYMMIFTMRRCQSEKKHYFVLLLMSLLFYLMGNTVELVSSSEEAIIIGLKLVYTGSVFSAPLFMLFTLEYCDIKFRRGTIVAALVPPLLTLISVWTLDYHTLFYKSYYLEFPSVQIVPGEMYFFTNAYLFLHVLVSFVVLVREMRKTIAPIKRKVLSLMMAACLSPLIAQALYLLLTYVLTTPVSGISMTPQMFCVTLTFFFVSVVRYDVFDFAPKAYSLSFNLLNEAVVFVDTDMKYNSSNKATANIFPQIDTLRKGMLITKLEDWPDKLTALCVKSNSDEDSDKESDEDCVDFELPVSQTAETRFYNAKVTAITSKKKVLGYTILIRDTTDVTVLMNQLKATARTDALTGIYNKGYFTELVKREYERSNRENKPYGAIMFDLDFFKKCNDTHGHHAGDVVLRTVATQVKDTIRSYDLFGRYGGEEFSLFIPGADGEFIVNLAERIREKIQNTVCLYDSKEIKITSSLGVALKSDDDESSEELFKRADMALYRAKENGRNQVVLYSGYENSS